VPRERRKGRFIINTGNGKGKTTAALGQLFRATGWNLKAVMYQFMKSAKSHYGEHTSAEKLGVKIIPLGDGYTWDSKDLAVDAALARKGWELAKPALSDELHDLVILDELTYPITFKWLPVEEVRSAIQNRPKWKHVVLTGRDCPQELIDLADTVTEMREVKHAFQQGLSSQAGIEL